MAKLLVVDDERDIRLLYSHDLSEERYQADTAASVSEAEEKLTESSLSTRMGHSRREARLTTRGISRPIRRFRSVALLRQYGTA